MKSISAILTALALASGANLALIAAAEPAFAQAQRHWRRGDVLPAAVLRAGPDVDYAAQRLRRAPQGYGWFALDGAFLLASLSTGLVLEVVDN
jgi:Ni/Co efflux regulator RcnB